MPLVHWAFRFASKVIIHDTVGDQFPRGTIASLRCGLVEVINYSCGCCQAVAPQNACCWYSHKQSKNIASGHWFGSFAKSVHLPIITWFVMRADDVNQCKAAQTLIYLRNYQGPSCEFPLQTILKKAAGLPLLGGLRYCVSWHL